MGEAVILYILCAEHRWDRQSAGCNEGWEWSPWQPLSAGCTNTQGGKEGINDNFSACEIIDSQLVLEQIRKLCM